MPVLPLCAGGRALASGLALSLVLGLALGPARAQRRGDVAREAFAARFAGLGAEGRPLAEVVLDCDLPRCTDPAGKAQLDALLRLPLGAPIRGAQVGEAWSRLWRTGLFREIHAQVAPVDAALDDAAPADGGPVRLRFTAVGVVVITDLQIRYGDWQERLYPRQFQTEIRKRLRLRKGGSFPPQVDGDYAPADARDLEAQRHAIEKLYADQGYVGTRVSIEPTYAADGKSVEVTVVVEEGRQPRFGQALISGNRHFSYSKIVSYLSTGERAHFWPAFFNIFGIGRYDEQLLKEELKTVEARYRREGYVTARVRLARPAAREGELAFPRIRVREGPLVTLRFEGNRLLTNGELRAVMTFAQSGAFDDTEIQASATAIVDAYQARARYFAEVEATVERPERDQVLITFKISEGPPVYVARVEVTGPEQIPLERVRAAMLVRGVAPDGVINSLAASSGVLQDAQVISDLLSLRDLYRDEGLPRIRFRCAGATEHPASYNARRELAARAAGEAARRARGEPPGPVPIGPAVHPDWFAGRLDTWSDDPVGHRCFWVEPLEDPRLVVLHIELSEGLRTTTDGLDLRPFLRRLKPAERDDAWALFRSLGLAEAGRFRRRSGLNRAKLDAIQGFMLRMLHLDGYLKAEVNLSCVTADGPGPCDMNRLYGEALTTVHFEVEPGERTLVDGILLNGNLRTDDDIVRNEIVLQDGGPLGTEALFLSQANLRSLGIFDAVRVETLSEVSGAVGGERRAAVMVTVEESRYQVLDALAGLQLDSSPVQADQFPLLYTGSLSMRDRNLAGRALEVGLGFNHANRVAAPLDVAGDFASWETGPFLKDRRLLGTRLNLNTELTFRQGRTAQRDAYQQLGRLEAVIGYDFLNLSFPDRWGQGLRATLSNELRVERRRGLSVNDERPPYQDVTTSVNVQPTLTWEQRDNPLHPTRGWFTSLSGEALVSVESDAANLSFREILVGQTVHAFLNKRLIVAPTFRIGAIQTDQPEQALRADFLFKAGGDGVVLPVRGYADATIDACGGVRRDSWCAKALPDAQDVLGQIPTVGGRAMLLGSLELRWPTFLLDDFWFTAFSDLGAVAADWRNLDLDRFHPSVGGGLRWLVTGQIPLRLDIAWPLRDTPFAPQVTRVHFNIFYTL